MIRDNCREMEIKWESNRLKLWYYHDVMISFISDVLIHFKWIKYNSENEIKKWILFIQNRHFTPYLFYINLKTRWIVDSFWIL